MIPLFFEQAVAHTNWGMGYTALSHVIIFKRCWCFCTSFLLKSYDVAIAAIATQNSSHELAETVLPKTIVFEAKYRDHIKKPNAPIKSQKRTGSGSMTRCWWTPNKSLCQDMIFSYSRSMCRSWGKQGQTLLVSLYWLVWPHSWWFHEHNFFCHPKSTLAFSQA